MTYYHGGRDGDGVPAGGLDSRLSNPSPIKLVLVTPPVLAKANAYARLVTEEYGTECLFFLLAPAGSPLPVATDLIFADQQRPTHSYVSVEPDNLKLAGIEAEKRGMRIIGWAHSHNTFNPFHSGKDVETTETMIQQVGHQNVVKVWKEAELVRGEKEGEWLDPGTGLRITPPPGVDLAGSKARMPMVYGYCYSFVVNAKADPPDSRVAIVTFCPFCSLMGEYRQYRCGKLGMAHSKVLPQVSFTEKELMADIKDRIRGAYPRLRGFFQSSEPKEEPKKPFTSTLDSKPTVTEPVRSEITREELYQRTVEKDARRAVCGHIKPPAEAPPNDIFGKDSTITGH